MNAWVDNLTDALPRDIMKLGKHLLAHVFPIECIFIMGEDAVRIFFIAIVDLIVVVELHLVRVLRG